MQSLKFEVFNKVIPLNNYQKSTSTGRRYTTKRGKDWEREITFELINFKDKFFRFRQDFEVCVDALRAHYIVYSPKVFTKKKKISKTKGDCDGQLKHFQDIVMNAIGIDDFHIIDYSVIQWPSSMWKVGVFIEKIPSFFEHSKDLTLEKFCEQRF